MTLLRELVEKNRSGAKRGLPSFCTSNDDVLDAILSYSAARQFPVLIEETCNQVNQSGGYIGMNPAEFVAKVTKKAKAAQLCNEYLVLGGDHLGPNPWRNFSAERAMELAMILVKTYAEVGFTKLHLDVSIACGDESTLSCEEAASRSADLCEIAEAAAPDPEALLYVIGTEVPILGGEVDEMQEIDITTPDRLERTIWTHQAAFLQRGLNAAFNRVIAVVMQPSVDFSHSRVLHYDGSKATKLRDALGQFSRVGFEAHSTDYQTTENLRALVNDHSVFLRVGPELTYRFREGIFSLDQVERAISPANAAKAVQAVLDEMGRDPKHWIAYYQGSLDQVDYLASYSLSDRIHYYLDQPTAAKFLEKLGNNLDVSGVPAALALSLGLNFHRRSQRF